MSERKKYPIWKQQGITAKWPTARLVGPNVTVEQALDFIWRTDHALQHPEYATNDRDFNNAQTCLLYTSPSPRDS